jgi:two-component system chemotaxis response regulator CheY
MTRTVVVVDDASSIRGLVAYTLKTKGFEILEAADGAQALRFFDGRALALVVTDLNMPVMDGITFVRELRTRSGYRSTPVIMLTTESAEGHKQQARAAGANAWVVKPFDPAKLLQVVAKILP